MHPNIFTYLDYRQYLYDLYLWLKEKKGRFSYRAFARMAKSPSPNFLQFIRQRKLSLSQQSIDAIASACSFTMREKRYLETLVAFDQAKTHEEKDLFFTQIVSTRQYGRKKHLQEDQYRYLSHWYMPVIRELVTSPYYPGDPQWIAEKIIPPISKSKVRKAIRLLSSLGLIEQNIQSGRWVQSDRVVSTPSEIMAVAVVNYYRSLFSLASDSMERFAPSERDIRGVTMGISEEAFRQMKARMEEFWNEMMTIASEPQSIDRVYHVGLQLFPLSKELRQ